MRWVKEGMWESACLLSFWEEYIAVNNRQCSALDGRRLCMLVDQRLWTELRND